MSTDIIFHISGKNTYSYLTSICFDCILFLGNYCLCFQIRDYTDTTDLNLNTDQVMQVIVNDIIHISKIVILIK